MLSCKTSASILQVDSPPIKVYRPPQAGGGGGGAGGGGGGGGGIEVFTDAMQCRASSAASFCHPDCFPSGTMTLPC